MLFQINENSSLIGKKNEDMADYFETNRVNVDFLVFLPRKEG